MEQLAQEIKSGNIVVRLAESKDELEQAQKLRYDMLVMDFNTNNINDSGSDKSDYDNICSHLIAIDTDINKVVGTYRLLRSSKCMDEFVCEREFDITNLRKQDVELMELSRAVVHKDYRNGIVIKLLWKALLEYCKQFNVRYMFGTASFHGVDESKYFNAFKYLYDKYLVSPELDCKPLAPSVQLNMIDECDIVLAKAEIPSLIKGYLAMGAFVSNGVYVDHEFGSMDVLTIIDLHNLNQAYVQRVLR